MSQYFEIAYAATNQRLCLFTGTGFSKALTANNAPGWQDLLEGLCDECEDSKKLKNSLFPENGLNPLSLEEAAQVLAIELSKTKDSIHHKIANAIEQIELDGDNSAVEKFCKKQSFEVVTTNYDKLVESLCGETDCQSITPGLPIPKSPSRVKVHHVHGSIDVPDNMVVTADDYFRFLNAESYFSRKLSTTLHENTVVILGYALGDTNLKAILNDYKGYARNHVIGSNVFFVSRAEVDQPIKDYYSSCYGIRVIDNTEVADFFRALDKQLKPAKECLEASITNIKKVVSGKSHFTEKFIKLENSFYEIAASVSATGYSIEQSGVVKMIGEIIETKSSLTLESGAWEQYDHLANWLIYLASILEITKTTIEEKFLEAVKQSMNSMSKDKTYGYSWRAYSSWSAKWGGIIPSNRTLIRDFIAANSPSSDAALIINRG